MWFVYALITMIAWGSADLFYKKSADAGAKHAHIKTSIAVGVVMGLHAIYTLLTSVPDYDFANLLVYLPVSLCYILSMVVGYYGLRYLMLSVSSPVQNSSGAVACILCVVFLGQVLDILSIVGVVVICAAVFILGVLEKKEFDLEEQKEGHKKGIGFVAFLMPVIYCVIDSLGTFLDAFYLDDIETTPLIGVTEQTLEDTANISYELTWFIAAAVLVIWMLIKGEAKTKVPGSAWAAAALETAGQATYVFAMSGNGAVAAPMIAAYAVVSLLLSRIFLKEKLSKKQYAVIFAVIVGIIVLGVAEGLAE